MKSFLLLVLAVVSVSSASAQLMFKNTKSDTFQVAVAMREDLKVTGWVSKGWFRLAPGDSASFGTLYGTEVRYFLHTVDNKISQGGTKPMLVDKQNAFNIKNADLKATEKQNPAYIWRDFHQVQVPDDAQKLGKLMIIL